LLHPVDCVIHSQQLFTFHPEHYVCHLAKGGGSEKLTISETFTNVLNLKSVKFERERRKTK
jgi:hypothetical protein